MDMMDWCGIGLVVLASLALLFAGWKGWIPRIW